MEHESCLYLESWHHSSSHGPRIKLTHELGLDFSYFDMDSAELSDLAFAMAYEIIVFCISLKL